MKWFSSLRVSVKLIGAFLIVAFIGAAIGATGILKAGQINELATRMYEREIIGLRYSAQANIDLIGAGRALRSAMLSATKADQNAGLNDLKTRLENTRRALDEAEKRFSTSEGKALVNDAIKAFQAYRETTLLITTQLENEPLNDSRQSTEQLFSVLRPLASKVDQLMEKMMEQKKNNADSLNDETDLIYKDIQLFLISMTIGGLLLGVLIGMWVSRNLTNQLGGEPRDVVTIADAIASGNLTTIIDTRRARDGSVVSAMQKMQNSLKKVVSTVRASSESIATGSRQIATGNLDLSARTEQQASSLEETASSMEELASTVKQNADNARNANQMASEASIVALKGGEVVTEVVGTMRAIDDSSKKIVEIIAVIDGLAFQTNILALNAAVEAARAGEQGRGFAVVASEVRTLAQRSAAAAKEIKILIEDSVEKVGVGSRLVDQAGETMTEIVENSQRVTDIISEITSAGQEQTSGIEQINQAVMQMDNVTQQNAALVEEAAAASRSLQEQALALTQIVSIFKVEERVSHLIQPDVKTARFEFPIGSAVKSKKTLSAPQAIEQETWSTF